MRTEATIMLATDIHYLSHALNDEGEMFRAVMSNGDGKLTERSPEIFDAFLEEARRLRPDAVVLPGDLTFNGERKSLVEVLQKCARLMDVGIDVLVIPGNHDIAYPYAARFEGEKAYKEDSISQAEFRKLCNGFGIRQAVRFCEASFSYAYELTEGMTLLFLDANTEKFPGGLDAETMAFAEKELTSAGAKGKRVIAVTHQNVLRQSPLVFYGFVMQNESQVKKLLTKHGVSVVLSGHSHMRHSASNDVFTDHATGALTTYPLCYAVIRVKDGAAPEYEVRELPVFKEEAKRRFDETTERQVRKALEGIRIRDKEKERMIGFAVEINRQYFSGKLEKGSLVGEEWELWQKHAKDTFWCKYFRSMF